MLGRGDVMTKSPEEVGELDWRDIGKVQPELLEAIAFTFPLSQSRVTYKTDEFTSVCPWTNLPDFASVKIEYYPQELLIELKSLKYYLTSYRNVGILQEEVVNSILLDLRNLTDPLTMTVEAWFRERGGIETHVIARYPHEAIT